MKAIVVAILICFYGFNVIGQKKLYQLGKKIDLVRNPQFIDSLKNRILGDTVNFNRADIYYSAGYSHNPRHYSKLYIVNDKYFYCLDIIENYQVKKFVNKVFNRNLISRIDTAGKNIGGAI